jgi:hypothetical protein
MSRRRHALHVNPLTDAIATVAYLAWALLDLAAEKTAAWWADHTPSERRAALIRLAINLGLAAALIVSLTACQDPTNPTIQQTAVNTDAVKVVQP